MKSGVSFTFSKTSFISLPLAKTLPDSVDIATNPGPYFLIILPYASGDLICVSLLPVMAYYTAVCLFLSRFVCKIWLVSEKINKLLILLVFAIVPTLLVWVPFFLKFDSFLNIPLPGQGMGTVIANYDGPLFIVVAKTFYNADLIKSLFSFPLPVEYYAAHFPLFPLLIRLASPVLGYPYAMMTVTLMSSFAAVYYFYKLAGSYTGGKNLMWLCLVFAIFPARWLIVRSVGASEPLFIATVMASLYYFKNKRYWLAGLAGALSILTRSPGILLFIAYAGYILVPNSKQIATYDLKKYIKSLHLTKVYPLLLIPLALLGLFYYYSIVFGDFWAYFNSGDNIHLFFPPFQIFNYAQPWVGTFWLEEVIFVYLLAFLGLYNLIRKRYMMLAWFVGIFFVSTLFVSHRDIIRYSLPMVPFILIGWKDLINKTEFKLAMVILVLPIYLFSVVYISQNVMPISDWAPFL